MIPLDIEHESPSSVSGQTFACLKLWAAVMELAVLDFRRGGADIKRSAKYYIFLDQGTHVGSFNWICLLFDRDPNTVREAVYPDWRREFFQKGGVPKPVYKKPKADFVWTSAGAAIEIPKIGVAA